MVVVLASRSRPAGTMVSSRRSISERRRTFVTGTLRCISLDSMDRITLHGHERDHTHRGFACSLDQC